MRFLAKDGGLLGRATTRFILLAAVTIGLGGGLPTQAKAGGYTVYIYNTRTNYGWVRTGFTHDLYQPTYQRCYSSIVSRVNENRRYRTDWEAFAIVYQNAYPPAGLLRSYVRAWVVYIPGRGYVASTGERGASDTAVCRAGAAGEAPVAGWAGSSLIGSSGASPSRRGGMRPSLV
jgi:hypothetical protein